MFWIWALSYNHNRLILVKNKKNTISMFQRQIKLASITSGDKMSGME